MLPGASAAGELQEKQQQQQAEERQPQDCAGKGGGESGGFAAAARRSRTPLRTRVVVVAERHSSWRAAEAEQDAAVAATAPGARGHGAQAGRGRGHGSKRQEGRLGNVQTWLDSLGKGGGDMRGEVPEQDENEVEYG